MHLAIVARALGAPGAVASVALRQARELTRHARITLVSDTFAGAPDWAETRPIRTPDLHALRRFRHVLDEILFARAAHAALREVQPDVVLAHSHAVAHIGGRGLGIPIGFFVHGNIFTHPKGTYDARLTTFYRWIAPRAYRSAGVVFALQPYLADAVRRQGATNVEVVPNGIDLHDIGIGDAGTDTRTRARSGPLRMLTVGRLAVEKGLEHLLAAMRLVDAEVELTIAGSGVLEQELRAAARDLPNVRFVGWVPRNQLGALYRQHDLFVTATVDEAFPLVVVEALACGVPVVATSIDALQTLVREEHNGVLVPPANPRALANAITRIARDESLRERMASQAYASVLPRYSWPTIGDRIAEILRRMRT